VSFGLAASNAVMCLAISAALLAENMPTRTAATLTVPFGEPEHGKRVFGNHHQRLTGFHPIAPRLIAVQATESFEAIGEDACLALFVTGRVPS
jgi:hypothetical protein